MRNNMIEALPISEVARLLAVSTRTVRRLIDTGELDAVRVGPMLLVPADALPAGSEQPLLTLNDVAAALGCAPRRVRQLTADGVLTVISVGRSPRWSAAEVTALATESGYD